MPIDHDHLKSLRARDERVEYSARDTALYALAVGLGRDPSDRAELAYVVGNGELKTLPSMAPVLRPLSLLDDCGWDASKVVPLSVTVALERPLEEAGVLLADSHVIGLLDRGAGAGAEVTVVTRARRERDGQPAFTVTRSLLARGDGGFGGPRGPAAAPIPFPDRPPDLTHAIETRLDQALLFRLLGDQNPIHALPAAAKAAGLERPILHNLCSFGIGCHALLRVVCEYDHTLMRTLSATWTGPVYPGDTLLAEIWQQANVLSFRLRVPERNALVLDHGRCVLAT